MSLVILASKLWSPPDTIFEKLSENLALGNSQKSRSARESRRGGPKIFGAIRIRNSSDSYRCDKPRSEKCDRHPYRVWDSVRKMDSLLPVPMVICPCYLCGVGCLGVQAVRLTAAYTLGARAVQPPPAGLSRPHWGVLSRLSVRTGPPAAQALGKDKLAVARQRRSRSSCMQPELAQASLPSLGALSDSSNDLY